MQEKQQTPEGRRGAGWGNVISHMSGAFKNGGVFGESPVWAKERG